MASIRNLKKDIHFLTAELASECMFKMVLHPELNADALNAVTMEGLALREELVKRAMHADGKKNPKLVKSYYKKLRIDMMEGYTALFDKLFAVK
jgi:hypothetical protein